MAFAYGALTPSGPPSQMVRLAMTFFTPRGRCNALRLAPTTPNRKRLQALTSIEFGLFPVRSPLLRESRLISLPAGTEMFHFPAFASQAYGFSLG
jgi:hypothetical protein